MILRTKLFSMRRIYLSMKCSNSWRFRYWMAVKSQKIGECSTFKRAVGERARRAKEIEEINALIMVGRY